MRSRCLTFAAALLVHGALFLPACAQQPDEAVRTAETDTRAGHYEDARAQYRALLDTTTTFANAYATTFLKTGEYDEGLQALDALLEGNTKDPYLLGAKGRLLMAVGRYKEAEETFVAALTQKRDHWPAVVELAALLELTGRQREGLRLYAAVYRQYQEGLFQTAENLGLAGRAAAQLGEFREANNAFRTAYRVDDKHLENLRHWAALFQEKYNTADAQRTYEEALKLNPNDADLHVGYAATFGSFARQEELAQKALTLNPNHVEAMRMLASLRILDGQYEAAAEFAEKALAINPSSVRAMAHLASAHHLRGDQAAFEEVEQQALAVNPRAGEFYLLMAEDADHRFRYADAEMFARKAVGVEGNNWQAYAVLGTSLMRTGKMQEARRYLDATFDRDPFNLFVGNTLTMLDEYENFARYESEHFSLRLHRDEADVLGPAFLELAEAAYADMNARYGYTPQGKITIEAYNDHDDFAVRVAGLPHVGLLGVCFGDIVAMDTPSAQAGRPYNWARTRWHELGHTMAIGVSEHRVPRWFTEGLSVYQERRARPEWGREMDLELYTAFDQGQLLPLKQIDKGFTRPTYPGQIMISYYHASKVITFIVDQFGFEAIPGILRALGEGQPIEQAIEGTLGQPIDALDRAFRADLLEKRARLAAVLTDLPNVLGEEEENGDSVLDQLTGRSQNPFFARLQEGHENLIAQRYDAAAEKFREALDLFPDFVKEGSPYHGLAAVYRATADTARLIDTLEDFLEIAEHGAPEMRELAALYQKADNTAQAIRFFERSLDVDPYDLPTHDALAELYTDLDRHGQAVRARRAILGLNPVDRAEAYFKLAESLYANRQIDDAKRAVLQSLELAPGFRDAQRLLLKCVDGA